MIALITFFLTNFFVPILVFGIPFMMLILVKEVIRETLYKKGYRVYTKEELRNRPDYIEKQSVFETQVVNSKDFDNKSVVVPSDPFGSILREMDSTLKQCNSKQLEHKPKRKRA